MNENMNDAEYSEVFQHEVGHFVDCQRGWESNSREFADAVAADLQSMEKSSPEGRMRMNDMLDDAFSSGAAYDRNVSDCISALFRNDPEIVSRFRDEGAAYYCHDNDYWARNNNRQSEIYANSFGIQSAQHRISKNFVERYFPNTNETFLKILSQKR